MPIPKEGAPTKGAPREGAINPVVAKGAVATALPEETVEVPNPELTG